jgi:hypothetical protein
MDPKIIAELREALATPTLEDEMPSDLGVIVTRSSLDALLAHVTAQQQADLQIGLDSLAIAIGPELMPTHPPGVTLADVHFGIDKQQATIDELRAFNESQHKLIQRVWEAVEPTGEYEGDKNLVEFCVDLRQRVEFITAVKQEYQKTRDAIVASGCEMRWNSDGELESIAPAPCPRR